MYYKNPATSMNNPALNGNNHGRPVTREIYSTLKTLPMTSGLKPTFSFVSQKKYKEIINFNNSILKRAIVIGFNPKWCYGDRMDSTNANISGKLVGQYAGYTLLNIFPDLTPNATILLSARKPPRQTVLLKYLIILTLRKIDILIIWGEVGKNAVSKSVKTYLNLLLRNGYNIEYYG